MSASVGASRAIARALTRQPLRDDARAIVLEAGPPARRSTRDDRRRDGRCGLPVVGRMRRPRAQRQVADLHEIARRQQRFLDDAR